MLGLMNILSACFHVDIMCSCTAHVEINLQIISNFLPFFPPLIFFSIVCVNYTYMRCARIEHLCILQESCTGISGC